MEKSRAKWIVAGLVAGHVVLNAIALFVMFGRGHPDWTISPTAIIQYALFMLGASQGVLLAFWAILGGGKFFWRVAPTVLGVILYVWCFSKADEEWLITSIGELGIWAGILLVARWTGLRLVRFSESSAASGPFQFYIRDMLVWTTAVAVILSAWRCLPAGAFGFLNRHTGRGLRSLTLVAGVSTFCARGDDGSLVGWYCCRLRSVLRHKYWRRALAADAPGGISRCCSVSWPSGSSYRSWFSVLRATGWRGVVGGQKCRTKAPRRHDRWGRV